jgi:hypothetical protein
MIVPVTTGSLLQVASVYVKPDYEMDVSQLYNFASAVNTAGATYGSYYLYFVGTDSNGSTWNLFDLKFVADYTTSSFIYYLDFNGATAPAYSWYYINPGAGDLSLPVYWLPLASLTNNVVFSAVLQNKTLNLLVNGSQVFTTAFLSKTIPLTQIYQYGALSNGSALNDIAAINLNIEQKANLLGVVPDIMSLAVVAIVVIMMLKMFGIIHI